MTGVKVRFTVAGAFVAGAVVMVCAAMAAPTLGDDVTTPVVNEDPAYAAPAPGPETTPETWVPGTLETQVFEDGSWLAADGTQGCTPGAACDQLPPVPAGEPTTPNGGYFPTLTLRPCVNEDSEDCYWDAARMGNGQGTSFIRVDGVTYYPEVTE